MEGGDMMELERAVKWLRPFVDSKGWDYCIVWKLGDDPSRFIEWMGCCCSGGGDQVKQEIGEDNQQAGVCRDSYYKHPVSTKACEALAQFPFLMALYSGIHGEVVISNQPRWLNRASAPDSDTPLESIGTQVLIPVFGGLIELFAAKNVAKDQNIIDMIRAHCNAPIKQEAIVGCDNSNASLNERYLDSLVEGNLPPSCQLLNFISRIQVPSPLTQPSHQSSEGSCCISNPSLEHQSFDSYSGYLPRSGHLKQSIATSSCSTKSKRNDNFLKQQVGLLPDCNNKAAKVTQRRDCKSKNLVAERNRRNRINDGILTLRALVPKISKLDKASTYGDAVDYIRELLTEVKNLQDEIKEIEGEDAKKSDTELKPSSLEALHEGYRHLPPTKDTQGSSGFGEKRKIQVQLEVNQIGQKDFLIKFLCEKKRGGFGRLMDVIDSLGLQVVDVNVTTLNGQVLNILKVEANRMSIQPKKLRESLMQLIG